MDLGSDGVDPQYPLQLGSFSTPKAQSSQWSVTWDGPIEARCHPDAAPGVRDGAEAQVTSRWGTMRVRLRHDPQMRPDMLVIPKGGWLRDGAAANVLVEARTTDIGLGAAYYDERVRIEPVP
jgi:anaerobic selenocysteine-containing dehydrogenase